MKNKLFYILLATTNVLFLVYYLILGYYNQPATDDYCVMSAQRYYGFHSPVKYWYLFWNARILPLYVSNIFLTLFQKTGTTIWYTISIILGFIFAIYRLLKNAFINSNTIGSRFFLLNFSLFIFNIFVYNNFKFNTFYWLNASTMYFGGILYFIIGVGEIISPTKKWYSYPLLLISFAYAGTSTENHALVMVLILVGAVATRKIILKKYTPIFEPKLYISTAVISLFFIILISAPGSQHRIVSDALKPANFNFFEKMFGFLQNFTVKYLLFLGEIGLMYLPYFLLAVPVIITLFHKVYSKNLPKLFLNKYQLLTAIGILIFLVGAAIAPTIYIFGNIGPQRVLTIANALLLCFGILFTIYWMEKKGSNYSFSKAFQWANISLIIIIFQLIFRIITEYPSVKEYASVEIKNRNIIKAAPEGQRLIEIWLAKSLNTPNLTERFATTLMSKLAPNQLEGWKSILKHEPILPNIPDKFEINVYEECYLGTFKKKIKILAP